MDINIEHQLAILTWAISGGLAGIFAFMLYLYKKTDAHIHNLEAKMGARFAIVKTCFANLETKMDHRFDVMSDDIKDIDRRLCRLEGAFTSKDCCMIKDSRHIEKAE